MMVLDDIMLQNMLFYDSLEFKRCIFDEFGVENRVWGESDPWFVVLVAPAPGVA